MTYRMIAENEIRQIPLLEQFFALAEAYLDAANRMAPAQSALVKSGDSGKGHLHGYFNL